MYVVSTDHLSKCTYFRMCSEGGSVSISQIVLHATNAWPTALRRTGRDTAFSESTRIKIVYARSKRKTGPCMVSSVDHLISLHYWLTAM